MLSQLRQDLSFAIRILAKDLGFTAVALAILALTIGATVSIFSIIDATLLQPLPYPNAKRIVAVWEENAEKKITRFPASGPNFLDWRTQSGVFEGIAAFTVRDANVGGSATPERLTLGEVSPSMFDVLGVRPAIGRSFAATDDSPAAPRVALLSDKVWRTRFGGDRAVLGRAIRIDGEQYTVIGVMPPAADLLMGAGVWAPLVMGGAADPDQRGSHGFNVVAKLRDGVSLEQAQSTMQSLAARLATAYPESNRGWSVRLRELRAEIVGDTRDALLYAFGAVLAVLLIGCANVANLLSTRAASRRREVTIRVALGAHRTRIVRQLLTESVALSIAGGALGLVLAYAGTRAVAAYAPQIATVTATRDLGISPLVLVFALLLSMGTGVLFGFAPALSSARPELARALRESSRGITEGRRMRKLRGALTAAQVGLSVALLIDAGLLLESLRRIERDDVGFRTGGRVALDISLAGPSYATDAQRAARFRQIIDRVSEAPGVRTAALVRTLPLAPELTALNSFGIEGRTARSAQDLPSAFQRPITPAYFETMGIPILRGRAFSASDDERAPLVAIVDSAAVRRFWPGEDPLGKRVYYDRRVGRLWLTVVGVVGSVKHTRTSTVPEPTLYVPLPQWPMNEMTIVAQTSLSPTALVSPIAAAVRSTDPELPVSNARTLDAVAAQAVWRPRFATVLLSAFAATALLLATLGIYGVTSYNVTQRRSEMALRIALGAQPSQVSAMVLGRSLRLGAVGVGIGLVLAALTSRFMSGLLYATPAFDLSIYATVALVLGAVSVAAGLVPALRAARVNLGDVLRAE